MNIENENRSDLLMIDSFVRASGGHKLMLEIDKIVLGNASDQMKFASIEEKIKDHLGQVGGKKQ